MTTTTHKGGREATGGLLWKAGGWYGRFTATIDGERVRVTRKLGTDNRQVAKAKLRRLVAGEVRPEEAAAGETFEEAARRIVGASGIKTADDRLGRLERFTFSSLGPMLVTAIKAAHVRECLETYAATGASMGSVRHLRNDVGAVLGQLWRDEAIPSNPVAKVRTPQGHSDTRERAVLTDEELIRYLGWEHPGSEREQAGVRERQTMASVSRMFGGVRTGDLHALRWEMFDTDDGAFTWGWAPRQKTRQPQRLAIHPTLRPILLDWWQRAGRPTSGLVFPALRDGYRAGVKGAKAGEGAKGHVTHAKAFRADLRHAFGLEVWTEERKATPDRRCAAGERVITKRQWVRAREMTARERVLFEETTTTKPVDFHSFRRSYNQALATAGVNAQQAMALAGHASLAAHERYLRNAGSMKVLPDAAAPRIQIRRDPEDPIGLLAAAGPSVFSGGADGTRTRGLRRDRREIPHDSRCFGDLDDPEAEGDPQGVAGRIPSLDPIARDHAIAADCAVAAWLRCRADQLAAATLH